MLPDNVGGRGGYLEITAQRWIWEPALSKSMGTHHHSEFQGEMGLIVFFFKWVFSGTLNDFAVLRIMERGGGILLKTSMESSNKGFYPDHQSLMYMQ